MKKQFLSIIFAMVFCVALAAPATAQGDDFVFDSDRIDWFDTKPTADIMIRDPQVLVYGQTYFMSCAALPGYGCYVSRDLEHWAGPLQIFAPPAGFDGIEDWWAPECHYYQGRFYLFATYKSASADRRRTSIFRADSPLGPYEEIFDISSYPPGWDTIDGTLYVDEGGQPWMVFVHEHTSMPDGIGDFSAARLSEDFTRLVGEPVSLFKANALPFWDNNTVTDGCWLYRGEKGQLIMLWSGFNRAGYCVAQAVSLSGKITGPWVQCPALLYRKNSAHAFDGGHGSLFYALDGRLMLGLHSPQSLQEGQYEAAAFYEVAEKGASLMLKENSVQGLRGVGAGLWNAAVWVMRGFWRLFNK